MAKSPIIHFRLDDETFSIVEKMAAARGQSPGTYAREMLLQGMNGEVAKAPADAEVIQAEVQALRAQVSKGIELIARLMFRADPNTRTEAEEGPAAWVQRELPR